MYLPKKFAITSTLSSVSHDTVKHCKYSKPRPEVLDRIIVFSMIIVVKSSHIERSLGGTRKAAEVSRGIDSLTFLCCDFCVMSSSSEDGVISLMRGFAKAISSLIKSIPM